MILITGGSGFIGTNFVRHWLAHRDEPVVNLDALTYAGNPESLSDIVSNEQYQLAQVDLWNRDAVHQLVAEVRPTAVVHFAAETHVDRSIDTPGAFLETNVMGTFNLLSATLDHYQALPDDEQSRFRFLHVSTDEVYGDLNANEPAFTETHPYQPNSPYSASKAASDHLVRAWHHTYGLPVLTTNCSNNYGPYQFPEKLIPLMIEKALAGEQLPVYGDGSNVRDWLYVEDHCTAIVEVLDHGRPGETYNIGGNAEKTNLDVVDTLTDLLQEKRPRQDGYQPLVTFVKDRPGHDRRYAIDARKITNELGWEPTVTFLEGLSRTIDWYLANREWVGHVKTGEYQQWVTNQYSDREISK